MNDVVEYRAEELTVQITPEQVELIRRTVAKDATPDELQLYFYDCARRGVHPLDKLIHFTRRGGRYVPITGIDFMRQRAHATGECAGISDATFTGKPGDDGFAATVTVERLVQNRPCLFTATARWGEYSPGDGQGLMWKKMPHTMVAKCAEALALRKGFPAELSGLYAREEMDQGRDDPGPAPKPAPPMPTRASAPAPKPAPPMPTMGVRLIEAKVAKEGKNAKGPWTLYAITTGEGQVWNSFSRTVYDHALIAIQEGVPVELVTSVGADGRTTVTEVRVAGGDREPGEEG